MSHLHYVLHTFGLAGEANPPPRPADLPLPRPGEIVALVGASGAGKTLALRALRGRVPGCRMALPLREEDLVRPVLELFDASIPGAFVLRTLARAGLADARLWLQRADTLSSGEARRLEIARALADLPAGGALLLDEFEAHLDDVTAAVLAESLRMLARREGVGLVVSTHRPELLAWLGPDRVFEVRCGELFVRREPAPRRIRSIRDEIVLAPGKPADWKRFSRWHYLGSGRPGPAVCVRLALYRGEPVGIAMLGFTHLLLAARAPVLPREYSPRGVHEHGACLLNRDVRLLQRVVVEPRFRGAGAATMLVRSALAEVEAPWVECLAQMGPFSGFLARAGFRDHGPCPVPGESARLLAFLDERGASVADLYGEARRGLLRESLGVEDRERLEALLGGLLRRRIETGHGARRGKPPSDPDRESLLDGALRRLTCRPNYFLWSRTEHPCG